MESPDKVRTLESLSANAADAVVGVNFASLKVSIQKMVLQTNQYLKSFFCTFEKKQNLSAKLKIFGWIFTIYM